MEQSEYAAAKRSRMATRRRWLQFSLRGFLVALTAFAVWLGIVGYRARKQAEAVAVIRAIGGAVFYNWQVDADADDWLKLEAKPANSIWLRRLVGVEYLDDVAGVDFVLSQSILTPGGQVTSTPDQILSLIPTLKQLPALRYVCISSQKHRTITKELQAALPNVKVRLYQR